MEPTTPPPPAHPAPTPAAPAAATPARPVAEPAALGWRVLALVYDALPLVPLLMLSSAAFLALSGGRTVERSPALAALEFVAYWSIVGAYFVFSWSRGGQTMGMRPWRLRLVADDGGGAVPARALWLRYLAASLTPGVCLLWCLVDPQRRGLHDLAARTVLVRLGTNAPRG
jgi:uncharacterized RDD family membrane protein YckC